MFLKCVQNSGGSGNIPLKLITPFSTRATIISNNNYLHYVGDKLYYHVEMSVKANTGITSVQNSLCGFPKPVSSALNIVFDTTGYIYALRQAMTSGQTYAITDDYEVDNT